MEIINARPEHFPQIYSLICELEEAPLDRTKLEAVYLQNLADPNIHYLIALENGGARALPACMSSVCCTMAEKSRNCRRLWWRKAAQARASAAFSSQKPKKPPERRDVYSWRYAATGNGRTVTGFMSGRGWWPAILNSRRRWTWGVKRRGFKILTPKPAQHRESGY